MAEQYAVFLLLTARPEWLSKSREARSSFIEKTIAPIIARFETVNCRFFDAEAFNANCSDVLMVETPDLSAYRRFIDCLRDTALFSAPYFDVEAIIPAVEDDHRKHDDFLSADKA